MSDSRLNKTGLLYLLVVYVVWGSTYLAIRIGVREGAGFTPFMFGLMRILTAGLILLVWSALTRQRIRLTRRELLVLAGSGLLFWSGGNGLVMVGEQHADSGLAALIFAGMPIWAALIEFIYDRRLPSLRMIASMLLGLGGIVILSMPMLLTGLKVDLVSLLEFVLATVCWAGGTVLQGRNRLNLSGAVSSGYQMFFGGLGFAVLTLISGEPFPHPTTEAWMALVYLILFGSLLAFTSYVQALRMLPTKIVTTYTYVNPVIAVILGWVILREPITMWTVAGAALILMGVNGVFRAHASEQRSRAAKEIKAEAEKV